MNNSPGWLRWIAGGGLLTVIVSLGLIMSGVFDPKPIGREQWKRRLAAHQIPAGSQQIFWLDQSLPEEDCSLRLSAAHLRGEADSGYGLVIGSDDQFLATAVSSLGYAAIWQHSDRTGPDDAVSTFLLPWQTWPHIRTGFGQNEIWLNRQGERYTIRINRELLWQGDIEDVRGQIGVFGESFGEAAVIDYLEMQLFFD